MLLGETRGSTGVTAKVSTFSRVEGELGVLLTRGRNLWVPLELQRVRQASILGARGKSGFLSNQSRGIGPDLEKRWGKWGSPKVLLENWGSS